MSVTSAGRNKTSVFDALGGFFRVATTKWMAVLMSAFLRACFDVLSVCLLVFYSWTFLCSARV